MTATRYDKALLARSVNHGIALVAADFERRAAFDNWEFLCECGSQKCHEWVKLPLVQFLAVTGDQDAWILAPDHPVPRARRARVRAQQLQEEARALRQQAVHQSRRAQKHHPPQ
jgi:hypothetical protein